jgi:carboxypeptidase family protein
MPLPRHKLWEVPVIARAILVLALAISLPLASMAKKEKDPEAGTRSVSGIVTSADDAVASGAIVQLKNTKTLQIRSFITQKDGRYYFHGLSPDIDYELKAESQGLSSSTKTLSSYDSRKEAVLNLKLNKK